MSADLGPTRIPTNVLLVTGQHRDPVRVVSRAVYGGWELVELHVRGESFAIVVQGDPEIPSGFAADVQAERLRSFNFGVWVEPTDDDIEQAIVRVRWAPARAVAKQD